MIPFGEDVHTRQLAEEPEQEAPRPGKPIEGTRLLLQLFRRRGWIIAAAVLGVAGGLVTAKTIAPRSFEARTAFVWEPREVADVRELRTRIDSVTLPTSLGEVRDRLDLDVKLDNLAERIAVEYDGASNLVNVKASAPEAEEARLLADAVVDVFLEHQRELERTRREEEVQVLREDVRRAKQDVEDARDDYDAFRRDNGITDLPAQRQQAIETAAQLRVQSDMAEAQVGPSGGAASGGGGGGSPRLREARRELSLARAKLSDRHPRIQALEAEVGALASSEQAGSDQVAKARKRAVDERRRRFEKVSEQARERLRELSEVEGRASQLLASVQVADSHLAEVQSELVNARDAATNPKSGFRVVAPALLPDEPVTSWRKPAAIAIPVAVVLLTVVLILVSAIRGLRLHTASEVAYWGRAAVVGSSNWPRDPTALNGFVDELGDDAVRASGRTLVLPAGDTETDAANQLAARLELVAALRDAGPWPARDAGSWHAAADDDDDVYVDPPDADARPYEDDLDEVVDGELEEQWFGREAPSPVYTAPPRNDEPGSALVPARRLDIARTSFAQGETLARRDDEASVHLYQGVEEGHQLRRATRRADRVLVVVTSGRASAPHIMRIRARLGRDDEGVAFVVVGLPDHLMSLPDRAGPVASFWTTRRV